MIDLSVSPFTAAVEKLSAGTPIGSILKSAEWELLPLELRESAFFSSTIESARFLEEAQSRILSALSHSRDASGGLVDRSVFIAEMRKIGTELGLRAKDPELVGTLQDPLSTRRLRLIFDMQTASAAGHAEWKMNNDPDLLDAFPAQELVRKEGRKVPREWLRRWEEAGGELHNGRMVALKTDAVWTGVSRFGRPWPPFDFQSGMGLVDLDRAEAEELVLLSGDDILEPAEAPFTEAMQADVSGKSPRFVAGLKAIFGDQVMIADGKAMWVGTQRPIMNSGTSEGARKGWITRRFGAPISDMSAQEQRAVLKKAVAAARAGKEEAFDLGAVSGSFANDVFLSTGHDIKGWRLRVDAGAMRHGLKHQNITDEDALRIPSILARAQSITAGVTRHGRTALSFKRRIGARDWEVVEVEFTGKKQLALQTFKKSRQEDRRRKEQP